MAPQWYMARVACCIILAWLQGNLFMKSSFAVLQFYLLITKFSFFSFILNDWKNFWHQQLLPLFISGHNSWFWWPLRKYFVLLLSCGPKFLSSYVNDRAGIVSSCCRAIGVGFHGGSIRIVFYGLVFLVGPFSYCPTLAEFYQFLIVYLVSLVFVSLGYYTVWKGTFWCSH